MAKRVLSLLLALVMALSLCVPAFAAEGTDTAAEGEADEPTTIALEQPADAEAKAALEKAVSDLKAAIATLEKTKAGFEDGTYTFDKATAAEVTASINGFYQKLAEAKALVEKINDVNGTEVKAGEVNTALSGLKTYLEGGTGYKMIITGASGADTSALTTYLASYSTLYAEAKLPISADDVAKGAGTEPYDTYVKAYTAAYRARVEAALAEAARLESIGGNATHKEYATLLAEIADIIADKMDEKPADRDTVAALEAAVAEAEALDEEDYTAASWQALQTALAAAKSKLDDAKLNGAADDRYNINVALENLEDAMDALKANVVSVEIAGAFFAGDYTTISVEVAEKDDFDAKTQGDDHVYALTIQVPGGKEVVVGEGRNNLNHIKKVHTETYTAAAANASPALEGTIFPDGAKVTFKLKTMAAGKSDAIKDGVTVQTYEYTVNGDYNGPEIKSAVWDTAKGDIDVTLTKGIDTAAGNYKSGKLTLTGPDGNVIAASEVKLTNGTVSYELPVKEPVLGAYTVDLIVDVTPPSLSTAKPENHGSKTVTVPSLAEYAVSGAISQTELAKATTLAAKLAAIKTAKGADVLELLVEWAEDYASYVSANATPTKDLQEIVSRNLALAKAELAKAATTVDTATEEAKIDSRIGILKNALAQMTEPTALSALEDAIKEANALNKKDYKNWDTLGIDALVKAGQDILDAAAKGTNPTAAQVKKAADDITAALKKLVINPTDKSELDKAIAAVPSDLETGNYSPDAVAAVEEALAAAQAVKADAKAPQSKIDAAASALLAAIGALKTVDGWVQAANGDFYYYKNGQMVKNQWVMSTRGLWYHMSASGVMDTGLTYITDASWGNGWYYLQESNRSNNCIGMMLKGWQQIIDDNGYGAGNIGWFETRTNGHGGKCTYTNEWGDFKNYVKQ